MVIFSEKAHYPVRQARVLFKALAATTPPSAWKIDETNPAGADELFYPRYRDIVEGRDKAKLLIRFWYHDPDNMLRESHPARRDEDRLDSFIRAGMCELAGSDTEADVITRFPDDGIPWQHRIAWRRWKIAGYIQNEGDPKLGWYAFNHEYPADDVRAFMSATRTLFDEDVVNRWTDGKLKLVENRNVVSGFHLKIVRYAYPNEVFVGAMDVADTPSAGDLTVFSVFQRETGEKVAEIVGQVAIHDSTPECLKLLDVFNHGWFVPEGNGLGRSAVRIAREVGYDRIYRRRRLKDEGDDAFRKRPWGFMTVEGKDFRVVTKSDGWGLLVQKVNHGVLYSPFREDAMAVLTYNPDEHKHEPDRVSALRIFASVQEEIPMPVRRTVRGLKATPVKHPRRQLVTHGATFGPIGRTPRIGL